MKTPRDLSGADVAKALGALGYVVTRQTGSHLRVTTQQHGQHHEVVPNHHPIKLGTLRSILRNVARHHAMTVADLMVIFGPLTLHFQVAVITFEETETREYAEPETQAENRLAYA